MVVRAPLAEEERAHLVTQAVPGLGSGLGLLRVRVRVRVRIRVRVRVSVRVRGAWRRSRAASWRRRGVRGPSK